MALKNGELGPSVAILFLVGIMIVFLGFFAYRQGKDVGKGFPFKDERTRKILVYAGNRSFLITIYVLLAIGWVSDYKWYTLDVSATTGLAILIMTVLFFLSWFYYSRKPNLE